MEMPEKTLFNRNQRIRSFKYQMLNICSIFQTAFEKDFYFGNLQIDFGSSQTSEYLNGVFILDGVKETLESKY